MSDKITEFHLSRPAYVYIRQSTQFQVTHNRESRNRQYALAEKAREFGWRQVEVIDEDLGKSGASCSQRPGFQRLLACVGVGDVGAVFSVEASRLARNNRDWHHLVDICGLVGTLLVDHDGVYDPRLLNDRLLLGLKGTMSEFELALIRQRSLEALRRMAQRGEVFFAVPVGYRRTKDNRCEKDPNRRVQSAIETVFEKFKELGSVRQALLWFRSEGISLPWIEVTRLGNTVKWKLPVYNTILRILRNPIYAGAYAHGKTTTRVRIVDGRSVKTGGHGLSLDEWKVLILDHHEGYIPWDEYQRNQKRIEENANMKGAMTRGAVRGGRSLLTGLLRCGRCGRKLRVHYSGAKGRICRYCCIGANVTHGGAKCISFGGLRVDRAIEEEILLVTTPARIDAAIRAAKDQRSACDRQIDALRLALEQAEYEAQRALRQYDAVDPENRLVAGELERRWNDALNQVNELKSRLRVAQSETAATHLDDLDSLRSIAERLPVVWNHPQTDMTLKKRIVRTLVEEIIADVNEDDAMVELVIRWAGGRHSRLKVRKNRTGHNRFATDKSVIDLVRDLSEIAPDKSIAHILNRLALRTGKGNTWTQGRVTGLRGEHRIKAYCPEEQARKGFVNMEQAAALLDISSMSVRRLIKAGVIAAKQVIPMAPWVIARSDLEGEGVKTAVRRMKSGVRAPLPADRRQLTVELSNT